MSAITFDATQVAPQGDRSAVPDGEYAVLLSTSEVKPGKSPTDRLLNLGMKITDGPLAGQMIFQNINFLHSNPVAQQIGQERLSALCHCVGVLKPTDTTQLHGRPFRVKVTVSEDKKYNEVAAFLKADGTAANAGLPTGQPAPGGTPAWAGAAAPTPAPTPAPAPAQPAPVQPASLAPDRYYVAAGGQNITPTPITADEVRALPQGLQALQICKVGDSAWSPATALAITSAPAQPAPTPAAGLPPWMQVPPAA